MFEERLNLNNKKKNYLKIQIYLGIIIFDIYNIFEEILYVSYNVYVTYNKSGKLLMPVAIKKMNSLLLIEI